MSLRQCFRGLVSILLVVAFLVSCTPKTNPTPTPRPVLKVLQVPLGWLNNDEFIALQAAQQRGFFAEEGLDVTLVSGGGSTGFNPILAIGGMDNSVRIGVPAALSLVLSSKAEGTDVIAIAALLQKEPSGFLTLIKNGRRAQGPCDFDGRIVSMQTDGFWYVDFLGAVCPNKQLKSGRDFTVIPAGWTPDCLLSNQCDYYCAWSTNQPFILSQQGMVEGKDYEMFLTADYLPFYYADVIVTSRVYATEHPEVVRAFVAAAVKGMQFVLDDPNKAIEIASSIPGVEREHATWRIPAQNKLVVSEDTKEHGLGYMDLEKVQAMIDFLAANGQIKTSFRAEEVIDNSFLPGK
ncbi:MAG: NMT1/THI5 like protein [Microgenomates group bacterium ADurb.Bin219]|nr:MAG: NMT1/THI5 like protein [Microgenomates group bacterium ADurb.Bin219]HNP89123.1 ABC transporter substrate-binding protein [Candidatus Woesebacteria bacterium]